MDYWIWIVAGIVLCGTELFTGAFVMLILGLGAIVTGSLIWLFNFSDLTYQIMFFVSFSVVISAAVYFYYRNKSGVSIGQSQQYYGEVGTVSQIYDGENAPAQNGQLRFQKPILGSDVWECRSKLGGNLEIGTRVKLISFEGKVALVEVI